MFIGHAVYAYSIKLHGVQSYMKYMMSSYKLSICSMDYHMRSLFVIRMTQPSIQKFSRKTENNLVL